jgi:hypothetical protein
MSALSIIGFIVIIYSFLIEKLTSNKRTIVKLLIFIVLFGFSLQSLVYTNILASPFGLLVILTPLLYGFSLVNKEIDDRFDIFYILMILILVRNIDSPMFFLFVIISKAITTSFYSDGPKEKRYNFIKNSLTQLIFLTIAFLGSTYLGSSNNIYIIPILLGLYFHLRTEKLRVYSYEQSTDSLIITKNIVDTVIIPSLILYKISTLENSLSFLVLDGATNIFFVFFVGAILYLSIKRTFSTAKLISSLLLAYLYLSSIISFELMISLEFLSFFTIFVCNRIHSENTKYFLKSLLMLTPISPFFYIVISKVKNTNLEDLELIGVGFIFIIFFINIMKIDNNLFDESNKNKLAKGFACFLSILVVLYIYDTVQT